MTDIRQPALNLEERLYRDENGLEYPVANWMDFNGRECEPEEAVVCVAGCEGRWFALKLIDFGLGAEAA